MMRTIAQHREQITLMVHALRVSLERILPLERDNDVEKAIILHCGMILFYQKLYILLASPQFLAFFNKNLIHLQNEETCKKLFGQLSTSDGYSPSLAVFGPEWSFMIEFTSIILSEIRKTLEKDARKPPTELHMTVLNIAVPLILVAMFFPAWIPVAALCVVLLILISFDLKRADTLHRNNFSQVSTQLSELEIIRLYDEIKKNISNIYPNGTIVLPTESRKLLPTPNLDVNVSRSIFGIAQSLFFKLPEQLRINQHDLAVAKQQTTHVPTPSF